MEINLRMAEGERVSEGYNHVNDMSCYRCKTRVR